MGIAAPRTEEDERRREAFDAGWEAAVEECALVVERYQGGGMQQVDIIKLALAAAIREIKTA